MSNSSMSLYLHTHTWTLVSMYTKERNGKLCRIFVTVNASLLLVLIMSLKSRIIFLGLDFIRFMFSLDLVDHNLS